MPSWRVKKAGKQYPAPRFKMLTGAPYLGTPPLSPLNIEDSGRNRPQEQWATRNSDLIVVHATVVAPTQRTQPPALRIPPSQGFKVTHLDEIAIPEWDASIARAKSEARSTRAPDPNRHQFASRYSYDELMAMFHTETGRTAIALLRRSPCLLCHSLEHDFLHCLRYYALGALRESEWKVDHQGRFPRVQTDFRSPRHLEWSCPMYFRLLLESRIANPSLEASSVSPEVMDIKRCIDRRHYKIRRPYSSYNDHEKRLYYEIDKCIVTAKTRSIVAQSFSGWCLPIKHLLASTSTLRTPIETCRGKLDTGSALSFVDSHYALTHFAGARLIHRHAIYRTATGRNVVSEGYYLQVPLEVHSTAVVVNLIAIPMSLHHEIILGMDFLQAHQAHMVFSTLRPTLKLSPRCPQCIDTVSGRAAYDPLWGGVI